MDRNSILITLDLIDTHLHTIMEGLKEISKSIKEMNSEEIRK